MKNQPQTSTGQELKDQAITLGRKLGFFINSLNASDEVKQAWLTVVENMSLEQLTELTDILETKFLDEQTRTIDENFAASLVKVLKEGQRAEEKNDQKVLGQIQALEKELDKKIKH